MPKKILYNLVMKRICKFLIFLFLYFLPSSVFAYQIGVWDDYADSNNQAINIKFQNNKPQRVVKSNLSLITSNAYPVLIFTNYRNFDENVFAKISTYVKNGGKLVLALPLNDNELEYYKKLAKILGVNVNQITKTSEKTEINWVEKTLSLNTIAQGTKIAKVSLDNNVSHLAVFGEIERHESAISLGSSGSVISWNWGVSGSSFFNERSMNYILEELVPKETSKSTPIFTSQSFNGLSEEIKKIQSSRDYIQKYQELPSNYGIDISDAQQNLEYSKINELWALYYLKNNNTKEYEKYIKQAKECAIKGVCGLKDSSPAENRGIWFDRGTIVNIKSRYEMGKYMETLKNSGINTIYFETVNAGYTIYPSKIGTQNPLTKGRDPLSWAISEAHSRGIKLQAWVWVFAVGNDRHNKIVNKPNDYAGPVLEKNMRWALLGENGNLRPKNQPEFWIDPSNKEGVKYLLSIIDEILAKYDVDGIQLDYIRYPFQSDDNVMGFNHNCAENFSVITGEKLFENNYQTNFLWNKWKENNINNFVKATYSKIKKNKPNAKTSAAIFTKSSQSRLSSIQQNWEYWAENGFIDSLVPMSYSTSTAALKTNIAPLKSQSCNCLIYPGVALQHVNETGIMEQTLKIREEGFSGVSFFALAQLSPEKSEILKDGFFSKNATDTSYNAKTSALELLKDYQSYMNNILHANSDLSGQQKNEISCIVSKTQETISNLTSDNFQESLNKIKQITSQNDAFFKTFTCNNDLKKQIASSYLKRAENLIKIYKKKRG